jgi:outer membrane protein TolC
MVTQSFAIGTAAQADTISIKGRHIVRPRTDGLWLFAELKTRQRCKGFIMVPSCRRFLLFPAIGLLSASVSSRSPARADEPMSNLPPPSKVASTVRRLTLTEARQLALSNNKALILARLNVQEKGYAATAARKDYLPKLLAIDDYFHFNDNLGSVLTFQTGKLGLLPPGAVFRNVAVFNQDSNLASLMVAEPITKLIAVNAAVQLARADQGAAQAQVDKGTRDLLSGVAQAYHGLLGAQRIQAALELQAKLVEQLAAAKPGPEARIFLVGVRQEVLQVSGQVRELTDQLNNLLDFPACTALELVDPVPQPPPARCADEAVQLALASNPQIREAEENIAKAEAAMKIARMAYLPDVSVMGGYANQTASSYIQPNIGYVGVVGNWTLFEWNKKRDVIRQREVDIALAHQNVQVTKDKVALEARKAYGHYEETREEYRLASEMASARREAEKIASAPAVTQAKADTTKAELEQMKAEITYRVAHAQLMGAIGGE